MISNAEVRSASALVIRSSCRWRQNRIMNWPAASGSTSHRLEIREDAPAVRNACVKPTISSAEIKKAMSGITSPSPRTTGNPSEFSAYDGQVFRIFYGAWARPGVPGLQPAKVRIFLLKNGRITKRTMIQGSGDPSFDQTVMAAVNSVSTLPKPPAGYPDNFVVRFSIID